MRDPRPLAERQAENMRQLLDVLTLRRLGTASISVTGIDGEDSTSIGTDSADVFEGESIKQVHNRTFGGQVLAQALTAASLTIQDEQPQRLPHSLHAYFMRPGDDTMPIRFAVERMRDGRSFATRRVHAIQHGRPILSLTASFQDPADGLDHQDEMPDVPPPASIPSHNDQYDVYDHPFAVRLAERPFDHRYPEGDVHLEPVAEPTAVQRLWVRAMSEPVDDPFVRAAMLAYLSDFSIIEPILRRHGLAWSDRRLRAASLDHAMWFHRSVDPSRWLLYDQVSPSAQSGRGLSTGRFFTEDGVLVASVAQEGMVRVKTEERRG